MTAYYNEFDPYAAEWLRNLIKAGHIAPGDVDERSIVDVRPDELAGYTQCHFFAGIGVWSYALRRAGWSDDAPVWTGSCPCQPFSTAGKGAGFDDERHLWPHFHWLISQCAPPVVLGEQVASKDGLAWLDLVQADLEGTGYASGAVDLCAAGVGAPHIRQRLWWVAERLADNSGYGRVEGRSHGRRCAERTGSEGEFGRVAECCAHGRLDHHHQGLEGQRSGHQAEGGRVGEIRPVAEAGEFGRMADSHQQQWHGCRHTGPTGRGELADQRPIGGLADAYRVGTQCWAGDTREEAGVSQDQRQPEHHADVSQRGGADRGGPGDLRGHGLSGHNGGPRPTNGFWGDPDWLFCRDGKWRPVESGTFPLAHGAPARVGRLRAYGNAIVAEAATEVIAAFMDVYGVPSLERRFAA